MHNDNKINYGTGRPEKILDNNATKTLVERV